MKPLLKLLVLSSYLAIACHGAEQTASSTVPADDPVLRAMKEEILRSKEKLQLSNLQRPYYIEYRIDDIDRDSAEAVFGSLRAKQHTHGRLARVVVRVGDYQHDSYTEREGAVELAPSDNDELALRHQLWLATDEAYKQALQSLAAKEAAQKNYQAAAQAPDFSHEDSQVFIEPLRSVNLDLGKWSKLLENTSALYRSDPKIHSFEASLQAHALNRYFMNSEGTTTRTGQTIYELIINGSTQADDGMRIERSHEYTVLNPGELPSSEQIKQDATTMLATLKDLRDAPLVEDEYQGPVLFSGDAASSVFGYLFAPGVAARKPDPGTTARTKGAFAAAFKARILPDFMNVIDDPTQSEFKGHSVVGSYGIDDEGVKSRPVTVVEKGQLVNFLIGRGPIRDFVNSNGHARATIGGPPSSHIGALRVQSTQTVTAKELEAKLLSICKEQGKPYGYYVETTGPNLAPRLLYRIRVEDGKRELVRGAVFGQLDTRALRNEIAALGDDDYLDNTFIGIPQTVIAPSILFNELEIKRANPSQEKLPLYPPPSIAQK